MTKRPPRPHRSLPPAFGPIQLSAMIIEAGLEMPQASKFTSIDQDAYNAICWAQLMGMPPGYCATRLSLDGFNTYLSKLAGIVVEGCPRPTSDGSADLVAEIDTRLELLGDSRGLDPIEATERSKAVSGGIAVARANIHQECGDEDILVICMLGLASGRLVNSLNPAE